MEQQHDNFMVQRLLMSSDYVYTSLCGHEILCSS